MKVLTVYFHDSGNECALKKEEPTIHHEDITVINIYKPNNRAPKYMKK